MGGGKSKYDYTDWSKADGTLNDCSDTIDNAPPTSEYDVYELHKKSVSQREFDILDRQQNLRYTTRAVPGTLAWFDVLGPKSCGDYQDLLLRVQVDISRRTWIVYRYHVPVFEGQKPALFDIKNRKGLDEGVELFKTACITVSWGRYVAVAARYGPPSIEDFLDYTSRGSSPTNNNHSTMEDDDTNTMEEVAGSPNDKDNDDDNADQDALILQASKIAARRRNSTTTTSTNDNTTIVEDDDEDASSKKNKAARLLNTAVKSCGNCNKSTNKSPESSLHTPSSFDNKQMTSSSPSAPIPPAGSPSPKSPSPRTLRGYFKTKTRSMSTKILSTLGAEIGTDESQSPKSTQPITKEERRRATYEHALEGVVDLNDGQTLIKCQEIYNKIIGNHQTSIVTKDQVVQLLQLDDEQHRAEEQGTSDVANANHKKTAAGGDDEDDDDDDEEAELSDNPLIAAVAMEQKHQHSERKKSGWFSRSQPNDADTAATPASAATAASSNSNSKRILSKTWKYFGYQDEAEANKARPTTPTNEFEASLRDLVEKQSPSSPKKTSSSSWMGGGWTKSSANILVMESEPDLTPLEDHISEALEAPPLEDPLSALSLLNNNDNEEADAATAKSSSDDNTDHSSPQSVVSDKETLPSLLDTSEGEASNGGEGEASEQQQQQQQQHATEQQPPQAGEETNETTGDDDTVPIVVADEEEEEKPQPLIAYWTWKNTYTVHKMQMDLSKNSDLALHVVLAILVNQVRYERNALAMTV